MRLVVHDYSGHPFQVQLSRELAGRGHEVLHLHCTSYRTGKGDLSRRPDDPPGFQVEGVGLGERLEKYSPWKRVGQEQRYARRLIPRIAAYRPQVVISSNTPLFAQRIVQPAVKRLGVPFVFWQQDIYGAAMDREARKRLPVVGAALGRAFLGLERRMLLRSDAIVCISEDFLPTLDAWRVPRDRVTVIENWAPLAELPVLPKDNAWAREHGLADRPVALYSGTLGLKHNPGLLLRLARGLRAIPDAAVVVISEGLGADWLRGELERDPIDTLRLLPFQPYERLPEVHASADVLAVILEAEAGVFSVPSKALSYHCAGRPLLAAVPPSNLVASIVSRNRSGVVVGPDDADAFAAEAGRLLGDPRLRREMGANARNYAEQTFDIQMIGDRFEAVLEDVA